MHELKRKGRKASSANQGGGGGHEEGREGRRVNKGQWEEAKNSAEKSAPILCLYGRNEESHACDPS
jgi:hypothetical protein